MPLKVGSGVDFVPDRDIPNLSNKVILVTGGTGGLGKAAILTLIKKKPSKIYVTARNPSKFQDLVNEIQVENPSMQAVSVLHLLNCDLADLKTVQSAAHQVLTSPTPKLDIFIGSAGVFLAPPALTKDGYEVQFGTNHMSHALLIKLLLPLLLQSPDPRIVLFTSGAFAMHPAGGILFDSLHTTQEKEFRIAAPWRLYAQSKLANVLFCAELARRYPKATAVSVHPGEVYTDGFANVGQWSRRILVAMSMNKFMTPEEGSRNALWAVTAPLYKGEVGNGDGVKESEKGLVVNGAYYEPVGVPGKHVRSSTDGNLARRLWEWTEKELEKLN
ncbi:putative oxidoreductase [Lachnellula subtilissima]|uniref:Putative oxidoreductase n=1 Tax=Lachnellula subtilissima TaxID=602034 RepID=A0A8H8RM91_9HELO|nr:putative oxidoreductase [Lachnellula subtilissima]